MNETQGDFIVAVNGEICSGNGLQLVEVKVVLIFKKKKKWKWKKKNKMFHTILRYRPLVSLEDVHFIVHVCLTVLLREIHSSYEHSAHHGIGHIRIEGHCLLAEALVQ
jgi:hypothetical protein